MGKRKYFSAAVGDAVVRKSDVIATAVVAIVASTTQTLVGATQLLGDVNVIATAANSGDAVKLPDLAAGDNCLVMNGGANPISVFPYASGVAIDGAAAGAAVVLHDGLDVAGGRNAESHVSSPSP